VCVSFKFLVSALVKQNLETAYFTIRKHSNTHCTVRDMCSNYKYFEVLNRFGLIESMAKNMG